MSWWCMMIWRRGRKRAGNCEGLDEKRKTSYVKKLRGGESEMVYMRDVGWCSHCKDNKVR